MRIFEYEVEKVNTRTGIELEISSNLVAVSVEYPDLAFGICRTSSYNKIPCCVHTLNNKDICEYGDELFCDLEERLNDELADFYQEEGLDVFPPVSGDISAFMGFNLDLSLILKNGVFYKVTNVDYIKKIYARKLNADLGYEYYTKDDVYG